jgi:hypothetical protein
MVTSASKSAQVAAGVVCAVFAAFVLVHLLWAVGVTWGLEEVSDGGLKPMRAHSEPGDQLGTAGSHVAARDRRARGRAGASSPAGSPSATSSGPARPPGALSPSGPEGIPGARPRRSGHTGATRTPSSRMRAGELPGPQRSRVAQLVPQGLSITKRQVPSS